MSIASYAFLLEHQTEYTKTQNTWKTICCEMMHASKDDIYEKKM